MEKEKVRVPSQADILAMPGVREAVARAKRRERYRATHPTPPGAAERYKEMYLRLKRELEASFPVESAQVQRLSGIFHQLRLYGRQADFVGDSPMCIFAREDGTGSRVKAGGSY